MAKSKKYFLKSSLVYVIIGAVIFAAVLGIVYSLRENQDVRSRAAPSCHPLCATEPACCGEILRQLEEVGDEIYDLPDAEQPYHACDWDANNADTNYRGYCRPSTCNQLPSGTKYRGHCGWYWNFHEGYTNSPNGYGCMIGESDASMRSICGGGSQPSNTPRPTSSLPPTNTPIPTRKPTNTPRPTKRPRATKTPVPATATPYNIATTATPIPNATTVPNASPNIIYISTTPYPTVPDEAEEQEGLQVEEGNDIISVTVETLRNFLDSIIYSAIGQSGGNTEPTQSPKQKEGVQEPHFWEGIFKGMGEFFRTVAP